MRKYVADFYRAHGGNHVNEYAYHYRGDYGLVKLEFDKVDRPLVAQQHAKYVYYREQHYRNYQCSANHRLPLRQQPGAACKCSGRTVYYLLYIHQCHLDQLHECKEINVHIEEPCGFTRARQRHEYAYQRQYYAHYYYIKYRSFYQLKRDGQAG